MRKQSPGEVAYLSQMSELIMTEPGVNTGILNSELTFLAPGSLLSMYHFSSVREFLVTKYV